MGKIIYAAKGAALEYSKYWAGAHLGCSCQCKYCSNHRWNWFGKKPMLKKGIKDENHALEIFKKELKANLPELQKHGIMFSYTCDPILDKTIKFTEVAMMFCLENHVDIKILTKRAETVKYSCKQSWFYNYRKYIAFGFTLTNHDELEPNASPNSERIEAMKKLHNAGFKTWVSIEPIIDLESSMDMIKQTFEYCDHYKIGLMSGKKYDKNKLREFIIWTSGSNKPIYFKDSLLNQAEISRERLPKNCITRDFNIFNQ